VETYIYFDTDTFHNFAETLKSHALAEDLRDAILFSPVTLMEAFAHLANTWGKSVHEQINGLHNWVNKDHTGVFPWMDDAINSIAFGVPSTDDTYRRRLKDDLDVLLNARLDEVIDVARLRRDEIAKVKTKRASSRQQSIISGAPRCQRKRLSRFGAREYGGASTSNKIRSPMPTSLLP
jgi:hypothetical protein